MTLAGCIGLVKLLLTWRSSCQELGEQNQVNKNKEYQSWEKVWGYGSEKQARAKSCRIWANRGVSHLNDFKHCEVGHGAGGCSSSESENDVSVFKVAGKLKF